MKRKREKDGCSWRPYLLEILISDWSKARSKLHHAGKKGTLQTFEERCLQTEYFKSAVTIWPCCLPHPLQSRRGKKWRKQRMLVDISQCLTKCK
ncbi:hypothetical protein GHT06_014698 [Daphnia sinensis]|uniref:Uncharacterized protein n=1 Tax=Daphnia sinensis TaxID=1820382 RepID=A0AAD5KQ87_9CRUS|nr:hypothetical protein GHT06_014698 [Daphnia sinensis]